MSVPLKKSVLGIGVSVTSYGEVLRVCAQWIEERRAAGGSQLPARYAAILNVHSVMTGVLDSSFRAVLNGADLGTSDGMPLVWAFALAWCARPTACLWPRLDAGALRPGARLGHRIFLYGGREETLAQLGELLRTRFPNLSIAGAYAPPFRRLTPEEDAACMARICASGADLAFVGIGAPKQERWMAEHKAKMPGVVMLGVGAAFDFHCGRVRQAPGWMQRAGLEWLFRLYMEPGGCGDGTCFSILSSSSYGASR